MDDHYNQRLIVAEKAYYRGGSQLKMLLSKPEKYLSGQEALSIYNTYGVPPYELKILLMSHGVSFDEDAFIELLNEQNERYKNMKQC